MHIRIAKISIVLMFISCFACLVHIAMWDLKKLTWSVTGMVLSVIVLLICMFIDLIQQKLKCGDYRD